MEVRQHNEGQTTFFEIVGAMDLYTMPELKRLFKESVEAGARKVVIHMERVETLSSSGIGALIAFQQELKRVEGQLALAALSEPSRYVLQLTKLTPLFRIFDTIEEARSSF
ncbi:MAG: STAS domain-containing protein [Leptospirales bacterium]|nr:STAS domain-containing protein [Leptospirales bacterium]